MNFVKMNVVGILQIIVSTVIVIIGSCVDLIQSHFCIIAISGCKIYKELIALFSISCCDFLMYSMRDYLTPSFVRWTVFLSVSLL